LQQAARIFNSRQRALAGNCFDGESFVTPDAPLSRRAFRNCGTAQMLKQSRIALYSGDYRMIASMFAMLLASAQPAPAEEPVVTEAEATTEVQAEVQADAQPAAPAAEAEVAAAAEAAVEAEAPAAPQEEVVCRRRVIPAERIGQRMRTVRDCRPASEWPASRRRGG
jgi:hypothetical protein